MIIKWIDFFHYLLQSYLQFLKKRSFRSLNISLKAAPPMPRNIFVYLVNFNIVINYCYNFYGIIQIMMIFRNFIFL